MYRRMSSNSTATDSTELSDSTERELDQDMCKEELLSEEVHSSSKNNDKSTNQHCDAKLCGHELVLDVGERVYNQRQDADKLAFAFRTDRVHLFKFGCLIQVIREETGESIQEAAVFFSQSIVKFKFRTNPDKCFTFGDNICVPFTSGSMRFKNNMALFILTALRGNRSFRNRSLCVDRYNWYRIRISGMDQNCFMTPNSLETSHFQVFAKGRGDVIHFRQRFPAYMRWWEEIEKAFHSDDARFPSLGSCRGLLSGGKIPELKEDSRESGRMGDGKNCSGKVSVEMCRRCKQDFVRGDEKVCRYHPGSFTGETRQRWAAPGETKGNSEVLYFYTCCGSHDRNSPGCQEGKHISFSEPEDLFERVD